MRILGRRTGWHAALALGMTCALSTALWAGGSGFGDDDHDHENEGPAYFGFVKDTNGGTVSDAKVTVAIKDRGGVITRTDALGAYRVPGFGKEINPSRGPDLVREAGLQAGARVPAHRAGRRSEGPDRDRMHDAAGVTRPA